MKTYILDNGIYVNEFKARDNLTNEQVFEYYINNKYVFGVQSPMSANMLQSLYDNGYFRNILKERR